MIERKFIEKGIRKSEMETYLNKTLERADYSHADIKRTPLNTRIVIYAGRPGVVIGHAGSKINEMTTALKRKFNIDNPQIEVKSVADPLLDAKVVAKQIASSLERGTKHRQIVNIMIKKIMDAGAIGVEITVSGKITGSRSRNEKFMRGYLKKCGNTADVHTQTEMEKATLKAGTIGIKVKLMCTMPSVLSIEKRIGEIAKEREAEKKESEKEQKPDKEEESRDVKAEKKKDQEPADEKKQESPAKDIEEKKSADDTKAKKTDTEPKPEKKDTSKKETPKKAEEAPEKKEEAKEEKKEEPKKEEVKKEKSPEVPEKKEEAKEEKKEEPKKEEVKKEKSPEVPEKKEEAKTKKETSGKEKEKESAKKAVQKEKSKK